MRAFWARWIALGLYLEGIFESFGSFVVEEKWRERVE